MAEDGEEALEKLGASPVDAIVTDLMMPRMDGYTLLKTLLARGDLTPAVGSHGPRQYPRGDGDRARLAGFLVPGETRAEGCPQAPLLEASDPPETADAGDGAAAAPAQPVQGCMADMVGTSESMMHVFFPDDPAGRPQNGVRADHGESGTGKERAANAIHRLRPPERGDRSLRLIARRDPGESDRERVVPVSEKGSMHGAIGRQAGCLECTQAAVPYSWMKSRICRWPCRRSFSVSWRNPRFGGLAGKARSPVDVRGAGRRTNPSWLDRAPRKETIARRSGLIA